MLAFKVATLLAVAITAFAIPAPSADTCSTGTVACCDQIQSATSSNDGSDSTSGLLSGLVQGLGVPVGLTCTQIPIIGIATSGTCSAQAACCDHITSSGSLIGINCSPINVGL